MPLIGQLESAITTEHLSQICTNEIFSDITPSINQERRTIVICYCKTDVTYFVLLMYQKNRFRRLFNVNST